MFTILSNQENAHQNNSKIPLTSTRMTRRKKKRERKIMTDGEDLEN